MMPVRCSWRNMRPCRWSRISSPNHYLGILLAKPGALPRSTALARVRAQQRSTAAHEAFWAAALARHGDAAGTRALIKVGPARDGNRPGWSTGNEPRPGRRRAGAEKRTVYLQGVGQPGGDGGLAPGRPETGAEVENICGPEISKCPSALLRCSRRHLDCR
jgi:hypothetical protein